MRHFHKFPLPIPLTAMIETEKWPIQLGCTFIRPTRSITIQREVWRKSLWDFARLISLLGAVMAAARDCSPPPPLGYSLIPNSRWQFQFPHIQLSDSRLELVVANAAMHINDVAIGSHLLCEALLCSTIRNGQLGTVVQHKDVCMA